MRLAWACAIYLLVGTVAASLGYHRLLAHRSFRLRFGLEAVLIALGLPAGTPLQWAGNHRYHHRYSDTPLDPHSPHHGGFWWAHCGWYLGRRYARWAPLYALAGPLRLLFDSVWRPRSNQEHVALAGDIAKDPVLAWFSRPAVYFAFLQLHFWTAFGIFYAAAGGYGLLAWYAVMVYLYNAGDAVDSVGHLLGRRAPDPSCQARDHWVLGLLAFGDGWHGSHHARPALARHGSVAWQFDLNWVLICSLEKVGIADRVRR